MKYLEGNLNLAITDLISQAETEHEIGLTEEEFNFLTDTMHTFVIQGINKYLKGAKEHGGRFLHDRDHKSEAQNEAIDLWIYLNAIKVEHDNKSPSSSNDNVTH